MATTEDVIILRVGTDEAVKSVNDLKNNIKELKGNLGELEIGSEEYQKTLDELKVNQNALKDAMYATSTTMDDVAKAATGASNSYNSLVHRMAALKEEWRATNDEARRNEVGKQIAEINTQLKDMDASIGNFQRNVGNYESGVSGLVAKFDEFGGILKQMPPTLGPVKESIGKVGEAMQLVGKQPILGIIGLLAPIIIRIADALKENETAMGAVNRLMEATKPIMAALSGVLELLAKGFSALVDWVMQLAGDGGWLTKFIGVASGVANAIGQYMIVPIQSAVSAFKGLGNIIKDIFTGQWDKIKEDAQTAWDDIKGAFSEGFSFKKNYAEGQRVGEQFIEGIMSKKAAAAQAGAELQSAFNDGLPEEDESEFDQEADWDYVLKAEEMQREKDAATLNAMLEGIEAREAARQREAAMEKAVADGVTEYFEEQERVRTKATEDAYKSSMNTLSAAAAATANLLNGLADLMESNQKAAEKNEKKVKALRIAAATIDMLQGAVTAFASAFQLGPIAGPIVGAINAAAVVAMGAVNIAKIKSTNPSSGGDSATPTATPVSVSAPSIDTNIPTITTATSASEEERLNRMASPQKVYILQSDIEAAGSQSKVQIEESSF